MIWSQVSDWSEIIKGKLSKGCENSQAEGKTWLDIEQGSSLINRIEVIIMWMFLSGARDYKWFKKNNHLICLFAYVTQKRIWKDFSIRWSLCFILFIMTGCRFNKLMSKLTLVFLTLWVGILYWIKMGQNNF